MNEKTKEDENKAFQDLRTIVESFGKNYTLTKAPDFYNYDAEITTPDGKKSELIEIKRRLCEWETYDEMLALQVKKANRLKKIQEETGKKVVLLTLYPKSDAYITHTLEEITAENNVKMKYVLKEENDAEKGMEWQPCYMMPLSDLKKKKYISINK
jgi:hypothetical protein